MKEKSCRLLSKTIVLLFLLVGTSLQCHGQAIETVIQRGHELAVISVAVSPDSNYIATGSRDKSIKLWELSTGREVRSFLGHEASVNGLDFSSDGKYLISSSKDKTTRLWEVVTGNLLYASEPSTDFLTDVKLSPNNKYFVASGYPDSAFVVDLKTKKVIKKLPVNTDKGSGTGVKIAFSPNGNWMAFGEDNHTATLYNTTSWLKVYEFKAEDGWCGGCGTQIVFGKDNNSFFMASNSDDVKKYDLNTGSLIIKYQEKVEDLKSIDVSHDNKTLLVAYKNHILLYDILSGKEILKIAPIVTEEINKTVFTASGNQLAITCDDHTTIIWDIKKNTKVMLLSGFLNNLDKGGITYNDNQYWDRDIFDYIRFKNNLLISSNGKELIKGKFGKKVKRWDIASGKSVMEYGGHKKAVICYELSRDGKKLITGGADGKLMVWDAVTGDSIQAIQSYHEPILDIHFNKDESKIISSSWDGTAKTHDLISGKRLSYFDFSQKKLGSAYNVIWAKNDLYIFSSHGKFLKMWEADTQDEVRDFVGHSELITSVSVSPDGRTLMSSSRDGSTRLWDIGTGLMNNKFISNGSTHTAIFSLDGTTIYTAGSDKIIRQWDVNNGNILRTFVGHKGEVSTLRISPDKKMLVSYSIDGAIKFWDLTTGKEFFEHIHFGEHEWMVKNPEGYFNGTQEARKYIHFVDGMKTYSVDQFFDDFYRPDLLPKIFQNRGEGQQYKGIQGKLNQSPPPTLKIAILPTLVRNQVEVYIKLIDNGAGIATVILYHNGKNVELQLQDVAMPNARGESATIKQVVNLISGFNEFKAIASNKDRIESNPATVEINCEGESRINTCYVLSVGINHYKNPKLTLNYARPDAESFGKLIQGNHPLFKAVEMRTLYDEEASKVSILKALDDIAAKARAEDVLIFYYAGHGSMVDNRFFFIPSESTKLFDVGSLQKESIEASVLQDKFKNIKALKQLIIMDACQSGGSVELLANRGAVEEKAIAQLARSAGIHVMASAGSEQFAAEYAELGHGLFTYLLVKALQGDADGAPKDGKVTIYELKSYLDDQVPEMTRKLKGKPQYPYTFSRGHDFPIVVD